MSLTKDGFFKQVDHKTGDDKYALLGAGGHKEWSTSNTANTLVARDANKYIYAQLFHSAESEMTTSTSFDRVYVSNDSYIRWKSKSNFGAELRDSGVLDGRYVKKSGDTMTGALTINSSSLSTGLIINRLNDTKAASIEFKNSNGSLGFIGMYGNTNEGLYRWNSNQATNYKIWDEGNDGSGSGLDADKLDGQHSDYYAVAYDTYGKNGSFDNGINTHNFIARGDLGCVGFDNTNLTVKIYEATSGSTYSSTPTKTITNDTGNFIKNGSTGTIYTSPTGTRFKLEITSTNYIKAVGIYIITIRNNGDAAIKCLSNARESTISTWGSWHILSYMHNILTTVSIEINTTNVQQQVTISGFRLYVTNPTNLRFPGISNISDKWATARTLTIGNTGKSVDGSGNVSWSLSEIGAQPAGSYQASGNYVPYETSSTRASVDGTNSYPKFYNLEGNNLITGYKNYWYVINLGKHTGNNFASQIAMNYQDSITDTDMFIRTANGTSWRSWRRVLHDNNYTEYVYSKTDADDRYVLKEGDTMTGNLYINKTGSASNSPLVVGNNSTKANIAGGVADQTTMIQIVAGGGGSTYSTAIGFHNPGISSAALEYRNTDSDTGSFNFRSDDSTWRVGIGTTNPIAKLHIVNKSSTNGSTNSGIYIQETTNAWATRSLEILAPNLTSGSSPFIVIGKAESAKNMAWMGYVHSSDGSTSNRLSFGLHSVDNVLNITGGAKVGIGTISPSTKLHIYGSDAYNMVNIDGHHNDGVMINYYHKSTLKGHTGYEANRDMVFLWNASVNRGLTVNNESTLNAAKFYVNSTAYILLHSGNYIDYVYSKSTSDDRYVYKSGDTMTGTLTIKTTGTGNYNHGIRINRVSTSDWALLLIGKSGDSTYGPGTSTAGDGAWLIGTPASSNSLIFNLNDASENKGLCLKGHGNNDIKWNNNNVAHAGNISNKDAIIGTSLTEIATIAGVSIKAKIGNFSPSDHTHSYITSEGFSSNGTTSLSTWGTLKTANDYTGILNINESNGGSWEIAAKSGQISMQIDGYFYQNEGTYRVTDVSETVTNLYTSGTKLYWTKNGSDTGLTIPYATNAGNADTVDGYHASYFHIQTARSYSTVDALPAGSDGWYNIFTLSDTNDGAVICTIKAYAHSSITFIASKGYSTTTTLQILQYNSSGNGSYFYVKGVRIVEGGKVQALFNKPSSNSNTYIKVDINIFSAHGTLRPDTSLTLETGSPTVISGPLSGTHNKITSDIVGNLTGNVTGNVTGNALSATKLATARNIWGQSFDGTADVNGNIYIDTGDTDKFIQFRYTANNYAGASWRLMSRGSGSSDTNYFDIETGGSNSSANIWYRVIRLTMDNRRVGINTDTVEQSLDVNGITQIYQRGKDNTAFKNLLLIKQQHDTESSGDNWAATNASFGIGFNRYWTNNSNPYGETNCAGIYATVSSSWRGGLVFRTKNNQTEGGNHDITALRLAPSGKAYFVNQIVSSLATGTAPLAVTSTTLNTNLNADLLDGYHAGVQNGQVSIFVSWPSYDTLKSEGFLNSNYGTSGYGYPDEEFLQAICKWAINHYSNQGDITLIGTIAPNSSGTCIMHLYSSSGYDSSTLLPRYCASLYQILSGQVYEFGCVNYVWYYRAIRAGNADTVDGYHASSFATSVHEHNYLKHVAKAENDCIPSVSDAFQSFRCSSSSTGFGDGYIISWNWASGNYVTQLFTDVDANYALCYRYRNSAGSWADWKRVPMSDGTGASGTWPISISGDADTVDGYHASSFATSEHSHGLTNSNFFKSLPSTSGNLTWKEAFGYNPNGALLMSVRINSPAPSWCVGNYGSGILYGGGDTKGFMSSAYSSPYVMWAGGNGTTDSATPVWTMSISGANGGSYNLANFLTSQDHYKTSITAGTAGTSSDTNGATLEVPYISMNANGHVTGYGTHTHSVTAVVGSYTSNGGQQNPNYFGNNRVGFLMMNTTVNGNSDYKDWMIMDCYNYTDVGGSVAIGVNRQALGAYIMRSAAARTSWAESAELIGTHNYTTYCATTGHNHDGRYVRAYGTTNDNIDSDWGQSFKTFDPIPSGTPPEQNPNITLLSLGDNWNRRKMLAFTYNNDNIYYRRHTDQGFSSWVQLIHSGNIGSQSVSNADTVDSLHASDFSRFYLSPMSSGAPADSAKSWFINTMPSGMGAIVYNVPGSEKTIIVGKSSGSYGHMLQIGYDDKYLRLLRYKAGSWQSTDWEKISAGYADSAGDADTLDNYHANGLLTVASLGSSGNSITLSVTVGGKNINTGNVVPPYASKTQQIQTQQRTNSSNHYLTFVDSDNNPGDYESLYTHSNIFYNPGTGAFGQGYNVVASGELSHAEGYVTTASGLHSHAEGNNTTASGQYTHAEGYATTASGQYAHAEGLESKAFGARSHAEGHNTKADGPCAHAEGMDSVATGDFTHAEGYKTQSYGRYSHVEGCFCYIAKLNSNDGDGNGGGEGSHCEGYGSYIMGAVGAHAEGITTYAYGYHSHTEGKETKTYGTDSHAEGYQSQTGESSGTDAQAAHAEGYQTIAKGIASHTSGYGTIANNTAEAAFGKYNKSNSNTIFSVGGGSSVNRYNLFEIQTDGTLLAQNGTILTTGNYQSFINVGGSITHTRVSNTTNQYILGAGNGSQPSNGGTISTVYTNSNFYYNNNGAYHASDARKKYDIRDILNEDVNKLFETENGFVRHFKWINSNNDAYGFIAQELQEYCPEAVDFNEDDGFYAVNYNVAFSKIIGAMFKKIKELERKLQEKENH